MTLPQTVPEVIEALGAFIQEAEAANSRLGLFPALYRKVTVRVHEGIRQGRFQDGERMARLDVAFANRYLEAYDAYRNGRPCGACWRVAFDATHRWRPMVLQHLLLGMAAHIQWDLGVVAATVVPGAELPGLKADFMEINALLGELLDEVQAELDHLSPWMRALDLAAGNLDEALARFGMDAARDGAWRFAEALANIPEADRPARIAEADQAVAALARGILSPGLLLSTLCLLARLAERASPREAIRILAGPVQGR